MMPTDPSTSPASDVIRPLKDVWLRPRRVFRELADKPLGVTDYALAALLGIGNSLALYRPDAAGTHVSLGALLMNSLIFGPVGIASMYLFASIYTRLGFRAGGKSSRASTFHVLAYGGVPVVAAVGVWVVAIALIGDSAFLASPAAELDGFQSVIRQLEIVAYLFLALWSVVLQVMGFSELLAISNAKALGLLVMGQILLWVGLGMLLLLLVILFPNLMSVPNT
jgi:Yip1 domain